MHEGHQVSAKQKQWELWEIWHHVLSSQWFITINTWPFTSQSVQLKTWHPRNCCSCYIYILYFSAFYIVTYLHLLPHFVMLLLCLYFTCGCMHAGVCVFIIMYVCESLCQWVFKILLRAPIWEGEVLFLITIVWSFCVVIPRKGREKLCPAFSLDKTRQELYLCLTFLPQPF